MSRTYQIYTVNTDAEDIHFGIPTDRVEEFDKFIAESPEALADIREQIKAFEGHMP